MLRPDSQLTFVCAEIRRIIGGEIRRGRETIKSESVRDEILIGLPEATAVTVIWRYFDLRRENPALPEDELLKQIVRERCPDTNGVDSASLSDLGLVQVVKIALHSADQTGYLSDSQIEAYIGFIRDEKAAGPTSGNASWPETRPTLHEAVKGSDHTMVSRLLANGADVNARDEATWTPLHYAAAYSDKEMVLLLVTAGADVNAKDLGGQTPGSRAWVKGNKEVIDILVEHGATPLKKAFWKGCVSWVLLLIVAVALYFILR